MEFLVDSINEKGLVIGRNGNIDIPLGTVFTKITKSIVEGDVPSMKTIDLGEIEHINLTLLKVEWYRKDVEAVPRGHTASLLLVGEGKEKLENALNHASDVEYVHIQA